MLSTVSFAYCISVFPCQEVLVLLCSRRCLKRGKRDGAMGSEKRGDSERRERENESCTDGPDAVTDWHADTHFLFAAHNLPNDA